MRGITPETLGHDGYGEKEMHERLVARGYPFERQHRVERWRIDLALWPVALEIERQILMPHHTYDDGRPCDEHKYNRLLGLFDRGWYVMTMRPPWREKGFVEATQLVIDYVEQVKTGSAPRYVSLQQYQNHRRWLRSEGVYLDGQLGVIKLNWPPPFKRDPNPGPPRFKRSY